MLKNKHGGSRPVKREDDGRLNRKLKFSKQMLVLDYTKIKFEKIKKQFGTRKRAEVLLQAVI